MAPGKRAVSEDREISALTDVVHQFKKRRARIRG